MTVGGNALGGLLVLVFILSIPAFVLTGPYLLQRAGLIVRVVSLHENGLLTSTAEKNVFWSWSSLEMVNDYETMRAGSIRQRVQTLKPSSSQKRIVLQSGIHGAGALDFVSTHVASGVALAKA